jgi:hypothetical protein
MMRNTCLVLSALLLMLVGAVPIRASAQCAYPLVSLQDGNGRIIKSARKYALSEHARYELLRLKVATDDCLLRWQIYLDNLAFLLQKAGDWNESEAQLFREKELAVRRDLSETFASIELSREPLRIYRNNVERTSDLYQLASNHVDLFDSLMIDRHFSAQSKFLLKTRAVLRHAVYSCNRWDFTYPENLDNKREAWEECVDEFNRLEGDIPALREIAPIAFDFLTRKRAAGGLGGEASGLALMPKKREESE